MVTWDEIEVALHQDGLEQGREQGAARKLVEFVALYWDKAMGQAFQEGAPGCQPLARPARFAGRVRGGTRSLRVADVSRAQDERPAYYMGRNEEKYQGRRIPDRF